MPVTLKLVFPAGRYHATPWGRHVNEGVPEWPPSPWRLLRALVAVWKRTCPDVSQEQVRRILDPLTRPPRYHLPRHTVAHTRHYMPWEKKGPADRTLVFDTFVSVDRKTPLYIHWPEASLDAGDEAGLRVLVSRLTSLGRAEGWVEAEVVSFPECGEPTVWNCEPAPDDFAGEPMPVFCPDPATAFAGEHFPPAPNAKKLKKGLKTSEFLFDSPRWHLCLDTETIHEKKWPRVPGAVWVNYTRPSTAPTVRQPSRPRRETPTVARFLLDGPVLPLVTETVRVAETFRAAAMSQFAKWCGRAPENGEPFRRTDRPGLFSSPVLAGRELGGAMRMSHGHAHYLPTAESAADPRRISHITVWASEGFGEGETAALSAVRELRMAEHTYRVQLVGLGRPDDFTARLFRSSAVWESVTPFVVHRHFKRRGTKRDSPHLTGPDPRAAFAELAVRELVQRLNIGRLIDVAPRLPKHGEPRGIEFRRSRNRAGDDGWQRQFAYLCLRFDQPLSGPICLGYACHYGLGLFQPPAEQAAG